MKMKMNKYILILIIIFLAVFLRIYRLNEVPISLFGDELDVGYQAYSILLSGKDYFGNNYPLMFRSYAEMRLPLFIYSAVPFVALFGLNEWGVRLTGVFWGLLGILGIYLLTNQLFKNTRLALIAVLMMSISPWHLQYSRQAGIESSLLLTILIFATWSFLKGLRNFWFLVFSTFLFAISFYSYATGVLFIPFLALLLFLTHRTEVMRWGYRKLLVLVFLGLLVLTPYFYLFATGKSGERFSTIAILSDQSLTNEIVYKRKLDNSFWANIFHNKLQVFLREWVNNYTEAFSPQFLFTKGDPNLRHSVGEMGEFYRFEIFTIIFGLIFLVKKGDKKNQFILLLGWLLLSPLSSSLTKDGGSHASRLMFMLVPLLIFSASGINFLWENRSKLYSKGLILFLVFFALFNISNYFHRYYVDWARESGRFWQTGYKEALLYIKENDYKYSRIYFNDTYESALPRFLFWYQYDPNVLHSQFGGLLWKKDIANHFDGYKITDKYYFGTVNQEDKSAAIERLLNNNELYLVSARDEADFSEPSTPVGNLKILKTVYDPFKKPIFYIVSK